VIDSRIEWCDDTVNPWWGCEKVSPACRFCYAEALDARNLHGDGFHWGSGAPRRFRVEKALHELERSIRRATREDRVRRVFVASMADVFEDRADVADARLAFLTGARGLAESWRATRDLAADALGYGPQDPDGPPPIRLLLLTKRPHVMAAWAARHGWEPWWWAGTTVEDQERAAERIPHLFEVPARVRFLSCEPLLERVVLGDALGGCRCAVEMMEGAGQHAVGCPATKPRVDWVIAGGESGASARPAHPDWFRSLREECRAADVPFFFKQWGAWSPQPLPWDVDEVAAAGPSGFAPWKDKSSGENMAVLRMGRRASGRFLDGQRWDQVPEGVAA
jgi:protein gp37